MDYKDDDAGAILSPNTKVLINFESDNAFEVNA